MRLGNRLSMARTRACLRRPLRTDWFFVPRLVCLEDRLVPDAVSAGPNGIDAQNLRTITGMRLFGTDISIGQVEDTRPGRQQIGDNAANTNPDVNPAGVFLRNAPAVPNQNIGAHATGVAGVMIANAGANLGVAPSAKLFSSVKGTDPNLETDMQNTVVSMQHVASQNPLGDDRGTVRAINLSFGYFGTSNPFDGTSTVTLGLDWLARVRDVLFVVAGNNQAQNNYREPLDNYNGLNVTRSAKNGDGVFNMVSPDAGFVNAADGRRLIDLVAPGDDIQLPLLGGGYGAGSGTSFAAPHATGTVALLQQYAEERIAAGAAGWDANARHH